MTPPLLLISSGIYPIDILPLHVYMVGGWVELIDIVAFPVLSLVVSQELCNLMHCSQFSNLASHLIYVLK